MPRSLSWRYRGMKTEQEMRTSYQSAKHHGGGHQGTYLEAMP